jgi:hypothetical protein
MKVKINIDKVLAPSEVPHHIKRKHSWQDDAFVELTVGLNVGLTVGET